MSVRAMIQDETWSIEECYGWGRTIAECVHSHFVLNYFFLWVVVVVPEKAKKAPVVLAHQETMKHLLTVCGHSHRLFSKVDQPSYYSCLGPLAACCSKTLKNLALESKKCYLASWGGKHQRKKGTNIAHPPPKVKLALRDPCHTTPA